MPSRPPPLHARKKRQPWDHRASASQRGYGAEHRRIRKQVLAEEPLCRECLKEGRAVPTEIADHITPLSQGGQTVRSNYQGLCRAHHDAKTARESAQGTRRR